MEQTGSGLEGGRCPGAGGWRMGGVQGWGLEDERCPWLGAGGWEVSMVGGWRMGGIPGLGLEQGSAYLSFKTLFVSNT